MFHRNKTMHLHAEPPSSYDEHLTMPFLILLDKALAYWFSSPPSVDWLSWILGFTFGILIAPRLLQLLGHPLGHVVSHPRPFVVTDECNTIFQLRVPVIVNVFGSGKEIAPAATVAKLSKATAPIEVSSPHMYPNSF